MSFDTGKHMEFITLHPTGASKAGAHLLVLKKGKNT